MRKLFALLAATCLMTLATWANEHDDWHSADQTTEEQVSENHDDEQSAVHESTDHESHDVVAEGDSAHATAAEHGAHEGHDAHASHAGPATWAVIPFVALLLMIATGPLFFAHFWHHHYPKVAIGLGLLVVAYYVFVLGDGGHPIHAGMEYIQFIALLFTLFMSAGGILIKVDKKGKPFINVVMLILGAALSNLIGTTGASMLLIRPFIRLNKGRVQAYHVMFFIFMVSNVGGSLTPIGDPPLFLGFLKGVPFAWTMTHNIIPWVFAISLLAIIFFIFDSKNKAGEEETTEEYTGKISIIGAQNFLWIAMIIAAVFIDPNVMSWVPGIPDGHGGQFSFIREIIMISIGCLSFYFGNKEALKGNEFDFEPIKEVAFIFIGIFFTMMPALQIVAAFAAGEGKELISTNTLYWFTGALSGVLDNAPTYLNFATAAISAQGGEITNISNVVEFAKGTGAFAGGPSVIWLTAISVASVFFGAMTYIGNAPNFMVKSIAEQSGVEMPSFFGYIVKFSLPILLPVLFLTWLIFFQFNVISFFI